MSSLQAVVLTERGDLRTGLRDQLKKFGMKADDIFSASNAKEAKDYINDMSAGFICLDWDIGVDIVLEVLQEHAEKSRIDSHPCFLVASKMDENIVAAAKEYQVTQIHTGEISTAEIKKSLKYIFEQAKNLSPIKQLMLKVANHRKNQDFEGAHVILEPLYQKMSDNPRVILEHGQNLIELNKYDEAQQVLEKALDMKPPQARVNHLLSKIYLKKGEHKKAVDCLEGAQLISPYNVNRLLEIGQIFLDNDNPTAAKEKFNDALKISPGNKQGQVSKGSAMLALGEVNEALSLIKEAATTKEMASVFNTAAVLAIKNGNHEEGIKLYQTALGACGKNNKVEARLWFNLGIGYIKWDKQDQGVECFKKSHDLDENFENAAHNLRILSRSKPKAAKPTEAPQMAVGDDAPFDDSTAFDDLSSMDEGLVSGVSTNLKSLDFDVDFDDDDLDM